MGVCVGFLGADGNIELSTLLKYTVVDSECEKASN